MYKCISVMVGCSFSSVKEDIWNSRRICHGASTVVRSRQGLFGDIGRREWWFQPIVCGTSFVFAFRGPGAGRAGARSPGGDDDDDDDDGYAIENCDEKKKRGRWRGGGRRSSAEFVKRVELTMT